MDLKGKTAIITGAKRIGKSVARALAEKGCNTVLTYNKSGKEIKRLTSELLGIAVKTNVTKKKDVVNLFQKAKIEFGRIDIVINMASHFEKKDIKKLTEKDFEMSQVDIKGTYLCCIEALKWMKKGHIINFSDKQVHEPYEGYVPYMAAKAGIESLTKSFASETKLNVNCIAPGTVMPPDHMKGEIEETGTPDDVAKAILDILKKDLNGQIITVG